MFSLLQTEAGVGSRPALSTHVLDTSGGAPAPGLSVELHRQGDAGWVQQGQSTVTNGDGRLYWRTLRDSTAAGVYKLKFKVEDYYKKMGKETLYPYVEITFKMTEGQHLHIPLLLSPFGYTTYRGS